MATSYARRERNRAASESIVVVDSQIISVQAINDRALSDAVTVTDNSLAQSIANRILSDAGVSAVEVIDNVTKTVTAIIERVLSDAVTVTDSITSAGITVHSKVLNDSLGVIDQPTQLRQRIRTRTSPLDALDSVALKSLRNRVVAESILVTDGITAGGVTIISRTLSDALEVTDQLVLMRERIRAQVSALSIADSLSSSALRNRVGADALEVSDAALRDMVFSLADSLDASDSSTEMRRRYRLLLDSLAASDSVTATIHREVAGISNVVLADYANVTDTISGSISRDNAANIKHGVEVLLAEHGVAINIHAIHGILEETS